jgi:hypothetical protein
MRRLGVGVESQLTSTASARRGRRTVLGDDVYLVEGVGDALFVAVARPRVLLDVLESRSMPRQGLILVSSGTAL